MKKTSFAIALIILFGVIGYANTLNSPFFFDDRTNIVENPVVKDFKYFTAPSSAKGLAQYQNLRRRYVGYLSFALDYKLHGLDVRGFHIMNLLIHILTALVLCLLVRLIFLTPRLEGSNLKRGSPYIALVAALLFVSHPLQTEAVTYIVQRFASLSALFYISAMASYAGARLTKSVGKRAGLYVLALALTVLAMKTKENAFTLPLLLALYEVVFFRDGWARRARWLLPFVLTMAIIPLTYLSGVPNGGIMAKVGELTTVQNIPRGHYLMTEFRVLVTYLRLWLLPVNQNLYYDYPVYGSFLNPSVFLSFLLMAGLLTTGIWLIIRPGRKEPAFRVAGFGIIWFFIAHAVESTVVPLHVIFEHRMYLPSAGLFITAVVLGAYAYNRFAKVRKPMVMAMVVVPLVLVLATHLRNHVWSNAVLLWQDAARKSPMSDIVHYNLANSYMKEGLTVKGIEQYRITLRLNPAHTGAQNNLGNALLDRLQPEEAIKHFQAALAVDPKFVDARNNLGDAYLSIGKYAEAIDQYRQALAMRPGSFQITLNMGIAFFKAGSYDEALTYLERAAKLDPKSGDAQFFIGRIYLNRGDVNEARMRLERALRLNPADREAARLLKSLSKGE